MNFKAAIALVLPALLSSSLSHATSVWCGGDSPASEGAKVELLLAPTKGTEGYSVTLTRVNASKTIQVGPLEVMKGLSCKFAAADGRAVVCSGGSRQQPTYFEVQIRQVIQASQAEPQTSFVVYAQSSKIGDLNEKGLDLNRIFGGGVDNDGQSITLHLSGNPYTCKILP